MLRVLLEQKAPEIIDPQGRAAAIDEWVLRALIRVPRYQHGVRSLEAILDMSMLAHKKIFEPAALPPRA